ncbi:hypothetical protein [Halococcus sp. AFM35]|uniref:hypothetical protein n=1 Tax=Halococcus sp. AFM35 TaxID=3421653 RepID=UPI003EBDFDA9
MDSRRKLGAFLVIAGLLVVIGNFQNGAPILSFEQMPDTPVRGDPVPYIVSWAVGVGCLVYGALLLLDVLPDDWALRRLLLK